jgi:hypothetical protein
MVAPVGGKDTRSQEDFLEQESQKTKQITFSQLLMLAAYIQIVDKL